MTPLLGRPLTDYIFIDAQDPAAVAQLEQQLLQTEITQPAVLATDAALTRLLDAYGMRPDMVMGHSLGEYGALVAARSLTFPAALEAVSARGREMAEPEHGRQRRDGGGAGAAARDRAHRRSGRRLRRHRQRQQQRAGGDRRRDTPRWRRSSQQLKAAGQTAIRLPVSHAFHTSIVAPASEPLKVVLRRLNVAPPQLPLVANVNGEFYPTAPGCEDEILDILGRQVASPVQFVKGLQHPLRRRRTDVRRTRPEEGPARVRRGRGRSGTRRRRRPVHQPPQVRRRRGVQPGAVRTVRGRPRSAGRAHPGSSTPRQRTVARPGRARHPESAVTPDSRARHRRTSRPRARRAHRGPRRLSTPSSSPARPSVCPAPSTSSTTRTSAGSSPASSSSAPSRRGSAGGCSTSTSRGWSRTRTARAAS